MAIKVNGTTVVDDSRNLTNIASVDATTVAALSAAGVGDITAVTAGSGLTGGGTSGAVTINHQDTSSQGSVNNSGNTVIQDVTLDTYGHVTGLVSKTISVPSALQRLSGDSSTPNWNKTGNAAGSFSTTRKWILHFTLRANSTLPAITMSNPFIAVYGSTVVQSRSSGAVTASPNTYTSGIIMGRGNVSKSWGPFSQDLIKLWYVD